MDVAFDAQIPPVMEEFPQIDAERWIGKMRKLGAIWIDLRLQLAINVELNVLTVRADHSPREANRLISTGPDKDRLQDIFFGRIALRLVEPRRRLGFTE